MIGLLPRADSHTLFDLNLLGINPNNFTIAIAEAVRVGDYEKLHGKELRFPTDERLKPSQELLRIRWREFLDQ